MVAAKGKKEAQYKATTFMVDTWRERPTLLASQTKKLAIAPS